MVHTITGNVIEPRVFGQTMDLHPVVVLLSLMLWGSLWGIVGMCLAVPITAVIKICLQSLDHPLPRFISGVFEGVIEIAGPATCLSPSSGSGGSTYAGGSGVGGGEMALTSLVVERDEMREQLAGDPLLGGSEVEAA